jgi:hypothetical protein
LKQSEVVTIYKQKGDAVKFGNCKGIKLLEIAFKLYDRAIERLIREKVKFHSSQIGTVPGGRTINAILILRQAQEKIF